MHKALFLSILPSVALALTPSVLFNREVEQVACSEYGEKECGDGCIAMSYTCCPDLKGGCPVTAYCSLGDNGEYGCCPVGKTCGGPGGATTDESTITSTSYGPGETHTKTWTDEEEEETTTCEEEEETSKSYPTATGYTTSTVYATTIKTITSCAPTVTHCPAHSTVVVTETIAISTTVCPITYTPVHNTTYYLPSSTYKTSHSTYYPQPGYTSTTLYPTASQGYTAPPTKSDSPVTAGAAENFGRASALQLFGALVVAAMMF